MLFREFFVCFQNKMCNSLSKNMALTLKSRKLSVPQITEVHLKAKKQCALYVSARVHPSPS